jgi:hypothetical protein
MAYAPMRVQDPPAESVTEVILLPVPVQTLTDTTSRSPALVAVGKTAVSDFAALASEAPADCTN